MATKFSTRINASYSSHCSGVIVPSVDLSARSSIRPCVSLSARRRRAAPRRSVGQGIVRQRRVRVRKRRVLDPLAFLKNQTTCLQFKLEDQRRTIESGLTSLSLSANTCGHLG